ncbi:MAG: hypothetical protein E5X89_07900 [Mesorhizobium sp.]|nr:MAG: hypothetical protein E5X88_20435 [Mesorhizobium sp.]TIO35971.1 MAG: hypothetical protein E5X89_07900 [Mesorhizobium sp.]TIP07701.1 MAG: hypothetical protein E5X73_35545 [Mesorhizobium sp.]
MVQGCAKARVGELCISGAAAALANAIYNATGVRVRHYPITLDKYLDRLPAAAGIWRYKNCAVLSTSWLRRNGFLSD